MAEYSEKRKCKRQQVPFHVEVRLESGVLVEGCALNVSMNGLLFETERSLPVGCRVRVYLIHESAPHDHILCHGEVARLDEWGLAISFDDIHPDHLEVLYQHLGRTSSREILVNS